MHRNRGKSTIIHKLKRDRIHTTISASYTTRKRIAAIVTAVAFNVLLSQGRLNWIPGWLIAVVWLCAGVYTVSLDENVRKTIRDIFRHDGRLINPESGRPFRKGYKKKAIIIIAAGIALSCCVGIVGWRVRQSTTKTVADKQVTPDDLTLHDLFLRDFRSEDQSAIGNLIVPLPNHKSFQIQYAIIYQLRARSKFLAYYIPRNDQFTYTVCSYLSSNPYYVLDKTPQFFVNMKNPGESGTVSTKDTQFTGRIYIYNETYLAEKERVELEEVYKHAALAVIFRDLDYLSNKQLEEKLKLSQKK